MVEGQGWPTVEEALVDKKAIAFLLLFFGAFFGTIIYFCVVFTLKTNVQP